MWTEWGVAIPRGLRSVFPAAHKIGKHALPPAEAGTREWTPAGQEQETTAHEHTSKALWPEQAHWRLRSLIPGTSCGPDTQLEEWQCQAAPPTEAVPSPH